MNLLHLFRQNKQLIATLIAPVMLMIWLSLSCQNCFAADMDAASPDHAAMDCCPSKVVSDTDSLDMADCPVNKLTQQPVVTDEAKFQIEDGVDAAIVLFESDYLAAPSSGRLLVTTSDHTSFSPRLFSSYRILQI